MTIFTFGYEGWAYWQNKESGLRQCVKQQQYKIDYVPIDLEIETSEDIIRIMTLENLNLR